LRSITDNMFPSSSPTLGTSQTLEAFNQGRRVERDGSALLREKKYEVQLGPEDDPQELPLLRRWLAVATISGAALCVACASSVASILTTSHMYYSLRLELSPPPHRLLSL
jgi:hypothetical protein